MSESQEYEEIAVTSDGVAVTKSFEEDSFPVPAIVFRIRSEREESVTVRLVDEVPDTVSVEDLGFHPEYGSEYWEIEDDEITFEREIEAGGEFTTVYGIRATGADDIEQFLTEPSLASVEPPLEDENGVVDEANSDVVRDVIAGNTDSVPGLEDDETEAEGEDDDIGTLELSDPDEEEGEDDPVAVEEAEPRDSDDPPEPDDQVEADDDQLEATDDQDEDESEAGRETEDEDEDTDADASADEGLDQTGTDAARIESVASALADEIREGAIDDDDLELLREELDLADGAVDARIERLQTEVSDLRAYTDALEEFLADNGTGEQLLEDLQERIAGLESETADNGDRVAAVEDAVTGLETELESLEDTLSAVDDEVDGLRSDLDDLQNGEIDDVEERLEDIDRNITDLQEWRAQLTSVLGASED